jgi:hypothetical protein
LSGSGQPLGVVCVNGMLECERSAIENVIAGYAGDVRPYDAAPNECPARRRNNMDVDARTWKEARVAFDKCASSRDVHDTQLAAGAHTNAR